MSLKHIARTAFTLALTLLLSGCGGMRAPVVEAAHIAELLRLQQGMRIADVGAGDGRFSEQLAHSVGESGRIYATEIDAAFLRDIGRRMERAGLENVDLVLGDESNSGLQAGCCDAILLRLTYHHFAEPASMRASLYEALRPGGLLLIIELETLEHLPPPPGTPDRGGHGILPTDLIDEMVSDGFEAVELIEDWQGESRRYCIIFRR